MAGRAEIQFKRIFPHAHVKRTSGNPYEMFTVYAGDYPCAEAHTKREAYKRALQLFSDGYITPDPSEKPKDTLTEGSN